MGMGRKKTTAERSDGERAGRRRGLLTAMAVLAVAVAAGAVLLAVAARHLDAGDRPVLAGGIPVVREELALLAGFDRAVVASEMLAASGEADSETFWTRERDGRSLLDELEERVKRRLVLGRAESLLALEAGVIEQAGYDAFLRRLEAENESRKRAQANGEVVYGPLSFDERTFYSYDAARLRSGTIAAWAEQGDAEPGEEELRREYEERKADFVQTGEVRLQWASFAYEQGDETSRQEAERAARQALAAVQGGAELNEAAAEVGGKTSEALLTSASKRSYALEYPLAMEAAAELRPGEPGAIVEERGAFHLLRCLSRAEDRALPFEEVREELAASLLDKRYEERAQEEAARMEVEWDERTVRRWLLESSR
ncbi:peptidylprolyl isomerase [Cohnella fermenti]|nr:peptidyl-prolyl cis-trans isomerase [Cohnella fermenti]